MSLRSQREHLPQNEVVVMKLSAFNNRLYAIFLSVLAANLGTENMT